MRLTWQHYEIVPLALGGLLASATVASAPWGLAILLGLWLLRRVREGRWTVRTPLDWPALLLLGMSLVAWHVTIERPATFLALSRLWAGLSIAYGLINWATSTWHFRLLAAGLMGLGLVVAILFPFFMAVPPRPLWPGLYAWLDSAQPAFNTPLNPNMVAGALVMLLPYPLAGLCCSKCYRDKDIAIYVGVLRWGACLSSLAVLAALYLTQSRGGWLAGSAVLFLSLSLFERIGCFLSGIFVTALGGWALGSGYLRAFLKGLSAGNVIAGWPDRVKIWEQALYLIQKAPLTGLGANAYLPQIQAHFPPNTKLYPHAHNLFLQITLDLGVPGLIAMLSVGLVAFVVGVRAWGIYRRRGTGVRAGLAWAGMVSLVAMGVHGMVDATTWIVGWASPLPWVVIGTLLALERQARDDF